MDTTEILKNIAQRCGGDIYLGVVGPGTCWKIYVYT